MTTPAPGQPLSDRVVSLIRTVVPLGWGLVVSWLIGLGIPVHVLAAAHDVVVAVLTTVLAAGWYAVWRWLEPRLPAWLARVVLGYPAQPAYQAPA